MNLWAVDCFIRFLQSKVVPGSSGGLFVPLTVNAVTHSCTDGSPGEFLFHPSLKCSCSHTIDYAENWRGFYFQNCGRQEQFLWLWICLERSGNPQLLCWNFRTADSCSSLHRSCGYVLMWVASDNATLIKGNVCHLSGWRSVQQIGVEKHRFQLFSRVWAGAITSDCTDRFSSLADIKSDKHWHSRHTNETMKCVGASKCSNLNNRTNCTKTARVNLNKLLSLIDPGKNGDFAFKWNWEGRVKDTRCFKNLSWFIKKSLSPETTGNRINLCSQCMCVWDTAEWFSSCLWGVISSGVACRCSTGLFSPGTRLAVSSEPWSSVCGENNMQWTSFFGAWGVTLK